MCPLGTSDASQSRWVSVTLKEIARDLHTLCKGLQELNDVHLRLGNIKRKLLYLHEINRAANNLTHMLLTVAGEQGPPLSVMARGPDELLTDPAEEHASTIFLTGSQDDGTDGMSTRIPF